MRPYFIRSAPRVPRGPARREPRHARLGAAHRTTWRPRRSRRWQMGVEPEPREGTGTGEFLARPLGLAGVLLLEAYFVTLGLASAFVLWRIWPTDGPMDPIVMLGDRVVVSSDPDARLILI